MNLIMDRFSRKIVLLFAMLYWQSSLGTNAIQLESQNLWNEKAQNGYVKYSNGLLIQWGMSPGVLTSTIQGMDTSLVMFSTVIYTKYTGYFYGWAKIDAGTWTSWKFNWIAIGHWK